MAASHHDQPSPPFHLWQNVPQPRVDLEVQGVLGGDEEPMFMASGVLASHPTLMHLNTSAQDGFK